MESLEQIIVPNSNKNLVGISFISCLNEKLKIIIYTTTPKTSN